MNSVRGFLESVYERALILALQQKGVVALSQQARAK